MTMKLIRLTVLMIVAIFLNACSTDSTSTNEETITAPTPKPKLVPAENIIGNWKLIQGIRNGRVAPTLEGVKFAFTEDKQLTSNLMGFEETTNYSIADKIINQRGGKMDADYSIDYMTKDSMSLSTKLRNFSFVLHLIRTAEEAENTEAEELSENSEN